MTEEMQTEEVINEMEPQVVRAETGSKRKSAQYNRWLVKNIPFYFFGALLAVVYIANGHYADKMIRETSKTEKRVKELEYEYKIVKRDVIFRSKQSELAKAVAPLGLEELTEPPVMIKKEER